MKAMSIHIGLDHVDPQGYGGWAGRLASCEADARAMAELAQAQGIAVRAELLSAGATFDRVRAALQEVAAELQRDDYLLITFAGHGASYDDIPTQPGAPPAAPPSTSGAGCDDVGDEDDGRDEAWCLYDTYLLDDELHGYFCKLAPGVRVCVVSDSCFSGTVIRHGSEEPAASGAQPPPRRRRGPPVERERRLRPSTANALYRSQFRTRYQSRSAAALPARARVAGAHIVLLAACQDHETAVEGDGHGLFTEHLLATWDRGRFQGSHAQFLAQIANATSPRQRPNLFLSGAPSPAFAGARPFTPAPG
jgi:hypothetical protein